MDITPGHQPASSDVDELEYLSSATLTKRKDFIEQEAEARSAPNRVLYYRRNADNDRLIQVCTEKLKSKPDNIRALLIRAASYVKKGTSPLNGRSGSLLGIGQALSDCPSSRKSVCKQLISR